jgi:hypothetical protein
LTTTTATDRTTVVVTTTTTAVGTAAAGIAFGADIELLNDRADFSWVFKKLLCLSPLRLDTTA